MGEDIEYGRKGGDDEDDDEREETHEQKGGKKKNTSSRTTRSRTEANKRSSGGQEFECMEEHDREFEKIEKKEGLSVLEEGQEDDENEDLENFKKRRGPSNDPRERDEEPSSGNKKLKSPEGENSNSNHSNSGITSLFRDFVITSQEL